MLVAVILLGYCFRRFGVLPENAFTVISRLVLRFTLPCVVIRNFARTTMDTKYLLMILLGFCCMALLAFLGYLLNIRKGVDAQVFDMLNFSGYNIGCFALPYVSGLTGAAAVMALCMFDAGNALGVTGSINAICRSMQEKGNGLAIKTILKQLSRSVLLIVYVVMVVLRLLHVEIPGIIVSFCDLCGAGNSFLAMLMIGLGMNLAIGRKQWKWIGKALLVRYGIAIILALAFYRFLPFSTDVKIGAALAVLSPVSSIAPAFTQERGGDYRLASSWNTVSILTSLALMTATMLLTA